MMARPIGEIVQNIALRAMRLSLISEFISTLPTAAERKRVVMALYEARIISSDTTELLMEQYGLEAA